MFYMHSWLAAFVVLYFVKMSNMFRPTPVQRNRFSVPTQVQKYQPPSAATNGKTNIKPYVFEDFRGRLIPIEGTNFEAKRPRANPYSHGYRS